MTQEEIQRNIEFIIGQQAQFTADIMDLKEVQKEFAAELKELKVRQDDANDAIVAVVGAIGRLENAVGRLETAMERSASQISELATAGKATEERLNAFIAVVERHIAGGNGKQS